MISEKENITISKFLSLVLRHKPETIGIELDANGWTDVEMLINKMKGAGIHLNIDILKHVVETNAKKRFAFNESMEKVRANQGHSVEVELGCSAQKPPTILYHGTGQKFVTSILEGGLRRGDRHHVHLSVDIETATKVGQRRDTPFIFEVMSGQMFDDNFDFFLSDNGVWLTDHVPAKYLRQK